MTRGPEPDPQAAEPAPVSAQPEPAGLVLELEAPEAEIARLMRGPALAALRAGAPARGAALKLTWFDTVDHRLAADGQLVELAPARRGARQSLLQVLPPPGLAWVPGTPPRLLDERPVASGQPDAEAAGLPAGTPLVGLAAAEGRRRTLALAWDGRPATLTLLEGRLRTVAAEMAFSRLHIAGEGTDAAGIAAQLAADAALLPAAPLPEVARALALGSAPRPARRGVPELSAAMTVEDGFVHAVLHLAATMQTVLPGVLADSGPEYVHQARVTLRRMRSAIAVWRPLVDCDRLRGVDAGLKDLAQRLGPVRDRDVFLAGALVGLEQALDDSGAQPGRALAMLRADLLAQRAEAHEALTDWLRSADWRALLFALLGLFAARAWREGAEEERLAALAAPLPGFAAEVLARRSRKLLKQADDLAGVPVSVLHALRLSGKRLRYAAEFFAPVFPTKRTKRYLRRLAVLQEGLGVLNDGAVAGSLVRSLPAPAARALPARAWAQGAVDGFAAARAAAARAAAETAWTDLAEADPFWTE